MTFSTQKDVDRLVAKAADGFTADAVVKGLYVRIQSRRATWIIRYDVDGKRRKMLLGEVGAVSLKDARAEASRVLGQIRNGADPLADRQARASTRNRMTVGDLVGRYLHIHAKPAQRPRTFLETQRALMTHLGPLHAVDVDALARRDLAERFMAIREGSGPVAANRCRAQVSAMYAWAMGEGLAAHNPVVGTNKVPGEKPRERTLTEQEICWILQTTGGGGDYNRIVRLLLLSAQRRDEVAAMCWSEISSDGRTWTLPSARSKNGREHVVPLSTQAQAILAAVERRDGRDPIFGRGAGGYSGYSRSKVTLDRRIAILRAQERLRRPLNSGEEPAREDYLQPWVLHDLRRSAVTHMAEIGISPHIIEAIVNHVSGHRSGVAGIYNRATYSTEKRSALQRWADHIDGIKAGQRIDDDKIVAIQGAGR